MGNRDIDLGGGYTILQPEGMIAFEHATPVYADVKTFVVLAEWYARDKNSVFRMDEKIEGADIETFRILGEGYAIDKNRAYIRGKPFKTDNIDKETLTPIRAYLACYIKDKNIVFVEDEPIKGSDPDSFLVLASGRYTKDKNHVYYLGKKIQDADIESFVAFESPSTYSQIDECAKDKNRFYYKGEPTSEEEVKRAIDEEQKRLKKYEI